MAKESKGVTVTKEENFSEWFTQVVQKAELADSRYGIQGFIVHQPWGFSIIKKIYEYLEKAIEDDGHVAYLFPMAVKEGDLLREKEHAGFTPDVFWITEAGSTKLEERFALRPTGEAQIYPMYSLWLRSHRDLPFKGYQSRIPAFRNDSSTRPFLRGREFMFFESHDVFQTHEEALKQIKTDLEICKEIIGKKIKLPFLYFKRPQWDKFKGAVDTFTPDTIAPDGKRLQLASTHDLGQNFSKAYNIKIKDQNDKECNVWQTCFGPGIWRIMAGLIAIHGDDKGLILPFDMAPVQIMIVPILTKGKEKIVLKECKNILEMLKKYRVKLDDREISPGMKYNEWELKGVPIRIEVGQKEVEAKKVTIAVRTNKNKETISNKSLLLNVKNASEEVDIAIEKRAKKYFKENTKEAKSLKELQKIIEEHRGFVKVPFCSVESDGEKCSEILKAETHGGNVCGTLYPKEEKVVGQKCIVCGKVAKHIVYVAKSY